MTSQLGAFTNRWYTPDVNLCFSGMISCYMYALLDLTTIINSLKYLKCLLKASCRFSPSIASSSSFKLSKLI